MADSREATIRRGYKAFSDGDAETFRAIFSPDVVHKQSGHNQTSGEHTGVEGVIAFYGTLSELSGGTIAVDLKSVTPDGDGFLAVHHLKAQRNGKSLDTDESIQFTFAGDKIARLDQASTDEAAEDSFWA
jgi:ketosteroid isomerase-like protein